MFTWNDFVITSAECDYELFFNTDYQRVVNKAIAELAKQHHWKKVDGWNLSCYEESIRITNRKMFYVSPLDNWSAAAPKKAYCYL